MGAWDVVEEKKIGEWDVVEEGQGPPISTITGKPVPTSAEKLSMSKSAMAELAPIAGDILGTVAAPQFKGPSLLLRGANMLMRGAGAGAGSVVGEVEKQIATQKFDPNQVLMQGGVGAAGELGTSAAGGLLKFIQKPALEIGSDLTLSGSWIKRNYADKIKASANMRVDRLIKDIAPESVKAKISESGINQALTEAMDEGKALYGHFRDGLSKVAGENSGYVPLEKTRTMLEEKLNAALPNYKTKSQAESAVIKEFGFSPGGSKEYQHVALRKLMRGEDLSEKEVNYLLANINPKKTEDFIRLYPTLKGERQALKESIVEDLNGLGAGAAKKTADEMHRELKNFQRIKQIYDASAPINRDTGLRMFHPNEFAQNVMKNERVIRETMPEVWPKLKEEAERMMVDADRIKSGQRSLLGGLPMLTGLVSSAWTGYIPVGEIFGAASAWALMSPTGKAALEGVFKYAVKPSIKAGAHMLVPSH